MPILMNRVWDMPNSNTFEIPSIAAFVKKYLRDSKVSIDPFARDCGWATYTNDLNFDTSAQYHLDVLDFLRLVQQWGIVPDLVIFDCPYSPRQIKECYDSVGFKMGALDAMRTNWKPERDIIADILANDGIVLSFGWNSMGMGKERGFEIVEILLVSHGVGHNDTICMAERKVAHQHRMF